VPRRCPIVVPASRARPGDENDGSRQELVRRYDDAVPASTLLVTAAARQPERLDVTAEHAGLHQRGDLEHLSPVVAVAKG